MYPINADLKISLIFTTFSGNFRNALRWNLPEKPEFLNISSTRKFNLALRTFRQELHSSNVEFPRSVPAVHGTVADGFEKMFAADVFTARQVGNRA